jgi:hypothetical protein
MANIYVRHTDGNNADSGATWALAKFDLTGAAAIDAAGDFIYVSDAHAESTASALIFALAGTAASPTRVFCADDTAEPPTASATTGSITTTNNSGITFTGIAFIVSGLTFNCGSGAVSPNLDAASGSSGGTSWFGDCSFVMVATGSSARIRGVVGTGSTTKWERCHVKFAAAGQGISLANSGSFKWSGGSLLSGGTSPTNLFVAFGANLASVLVEDVDLSNLSTTANLVNGGGSYAAHVVFRRCKLPSGWTGTLATGVTVGERYEMHACDDGDTNYRLWVIEYSGNIYSETVIVRSGGASDGTTPLSWRMATNTVPEYPLLVLASPEFAAWNDTTGSAITVTVEVITDGVTLNDDECWLEVNYLGTSGVPLGATSSDAKADIIAAGAAQTSSSETWTTTGLSSPTKQKLSVTFTPQEKGYLQAVVKLAKASTTVYVDPYLTVT